MNNGHDPLVQKVLAGREPEFSLMSRRPGIGVGAAGGIAESIKKFNLVSPDSDVPVTVRHGSRQLPLGRLMRQKVREEVYGVVQKFVPREGVNYVLSKPVEKPKAKQKENLHLQYMREVARSDSENPSVKYHLIKSGDQRVRNMNARREVRKKDRKL